MPSTPFNDYIQGLYNQQQRKNAAEALKAQQEANKRVEDARRRLFEELNSQYQAKNFGGFDWSGFDIGGPAKPVKPQLPAKVQKIYDLYKGTNNAGEKNAALTALTRMGYKVQGDSVVKV